jgi:hypothetical protein
VGEQLGTVPFELVAEVRRQRKASWDPVIVTPAQILAAAFHNDAMFVFIEPDGERRRRVLPWFFGTAIRIGRHLGRVDLDPERGVAIWLRPGARFGMLAIIRSGLVVAPLRFGRSAMKRFGRLTSAFEEAGARVRGDRYWHLFILGSSRVTRARASVAGCSAPSWSRRMRRESAALWRRSRSATWPSTPGWGLRWARRCRGPGCRR